MPIVEMFVVTDVLSRDIFSKK